MSGVAEVLERVWGSCGETVLRRRGADLEIVVSGAFLMSTANGASSRALVSAALPYVKGGRLEVFIGGLGLGYALDEALACPRVAGVMVAELEPTIVRWFREYGEERAVRAAEGGRDGRVRLEIADATALLAARPAAVFARTLSVAASDIVQDRIHECTLYVGIREG